MIQHKIKGDGLELVEEKVKKEFPDCFPSNFTKDILPQNLPDLQLEVFRVCTTGEICKETFFEYIRKCVSWSYSEALELG